MHSGSTKCSSWHGVLATESLEGKRVLFMEVHNVLDLLSVSTSISITISSKMKPGLIFTFWQECVLQSSGTRNTSALSGSATGLPGRHNGTHVGETCGGRGGERKRGQKTARKGLVDGAAFLQSQPPGSRVCDRGSADNRLASVIPRPNPQNGVREKGGV